ncbi:Uncharacterised protein [Enterobacter cloacae]|nr:Uncharacterised protein [Enterobacter cloacae]
MHHVVGEEQRNFQAAQFHHLILHFADILAGNGVKNGSYLPVFDHLANGFFRVIRADAYQAQLADFLIDRHLFE